MKKSLLFFFVFIFWTQLFATVNQIRWGSSGDPLNGLTVTWSNNGLTDSLRWGYSTSYEQGSYAGLRRNGYSSGIYFFKYVFPTVNTSATIYYQIFDSGNQIWTTQHTFKTAPNPTSGTFTFAALGDCRDYPAILTAISNLVTTRHPSLCLFNGDLTFSGNSASEYNTFFSAASNFLLNNLVYHAEGNHDASSPTLFFNLWNLPQVNNSSSFYSVRLQFQTRLRCQLIRPVLSRSI